MKTWITFFLLALMPSLSFAEPEEMETPDSPELALGVLDEAIRAHKALIDKYQKQRKTSVELRWKLAEIVDEKSYTYKKSYDIDTQTHRKAYDEILKEEISVIDTIIKQCPGYSFCSKALLSHAEAWQRLDRPDMARKDLEELILKYRKSEEYPIAILHLAQQEMDSNDYASAIRILLRIRASCPQEYRPKVLERLSWAYAGAGDFATALSLSKECLNVLKSNGPGVPSHGINLSAVALNTAIFYARALEAKTPGYNGRSALEFFASVVPQEVLMIAIRNFPNLLTAAALAPELDTFAKATLEIYPHEAFTFAVLTSVTEKNIALRRLSSLQENLIGFQTYIKQNPELDRKSLTLGTTLAKAEKNLLSLMAEEKSHPSGYTREYTSSVLRQVYTLSQDYLVENTVVRAQFEFNLGALEFTEKNYASASQHFKAVCDAELPNSKESKILQSRASMELLRVGFRSILARAKNLPRESSELNNEIELWGNWSEKHQDKFGKTPEISAMRFQIAKSCYQAGAKDSVMAWIDSAAQDSPSRAEKSDAYQMLLAYYLEKQDWRQLLSISQRADKVSDLTVPTKKLVSKSKDQAIYQMVLLAKDNRSTVRAIQHWENQVSDPEISSEMKFRLASLQGKTAEEHSQLTEARQIYVDFLTQAPPKTAWPIEWNTMAERAYVLAILRPEEKNTRRILGSMDLCNHVKDKCDAMGTMAAYDGINPWPPSVPYAYVATALKIRSAPKIVPMKDFEFLIQQFTKRPGPKDKIDSIVAEKTWNVLGPKLRLTMNYENQKLKEFSLAKGLVAIPVRLKQIKELERQVTLFSQIPYAELYDIAKWGLVVGYENMRSELQGLQMAIAKKPSSEKQQTLAAIEDLTHQFDGLIADLAHQGISTRGIASKNSNAKTKGRNP